MAGAAGTAAHQQPDGSYVIRVKAGRKPSRAIIIHEAVHAHQSSMGEKAFGWEQKFSDAAVKDNLSARNPLWGASDLWNGSEIWASAAGFYYGGSPHFLSGSSPGVKALIVELYGSLISESDIGSALTEARQWQPIIDTMSDVNKLVHLASRMDQFDVDEIRTRLLRERRRIYASELEAQAAMVGCPGRRADLTNGPILSELNTMCQTDAISIVNTYNYDLAAAIIRVRSDTPRANRFTYASRLDVWREKRKIWKDAQITLYTEGSTRSLAQQHFYQHNGNMGKAILEPRKAVCPVCQGWIERGEVPLRVALNTIVPVHVNCPHLWVVDPDKWPKGECYLLWMGQ